MANIDLIVKGKYVLPMNPGMDIIDDGMVVVLDQKKLTKEEFVGNIRKLIFDKEKQKEISENIKKVIKRGANKSLVKIILQNI